MKIVSGFLAGICAGLSIAGLIVGYETDATDVIAGSCIGIVLSVLVVIATARVGGER